jgi:hypothetical protein
MNTTNKYDMHRNPVYQIDCAVTAKGKLVKASKRRVRWAFGFSNREAMVQGLSGTDCRGEEHEVVMVWSLTSGKQFVLADGIETYFSKSGLTDRLECSWTMKGGHEFRVVAHLFAQPGVRQFDLSIDGLSFCDMPKMFQLGKSEGAATAAPSRMRSAPQHFHYSNPRLPAFEEQVVQQPRRVQSCVNFMQLQQEVPTADLLSDFETHVFSSTTPSPTSVMDAFAPQPSTPLTFQDTASQSWRSYNSTPPPQMTVETSWQLQQQQQALVTPDSSVRTSRSYMDIPFCDSAEVGEGHMVEAAAAAPITPLTMHPLSNRAIDMSPMEQALNSLVNFDDMAQAQESPEQILRTNAQHHSNQQADSWHSGSETCLADIQAHSSQQQQPRKQVMRTYAFDSSNMMVNYGQQQHHGFGMHTAQQPVFCG